VPPGIAVTTQPWNLPSWLSPPLVIKPAFEHMSRAYTLSTPARKRTVPLHSSWNRSDSRFC